MTTAPEWKPDVYARFARERRRPFDDLLARIGDIDPRIVVDLGCGDGLLTVELARRWPQARVIGIEPPPQMLAKARAHTDANVEWREQPAEDWRAGGDGPIDLLVTNAVLQWVPTHRELLLRWLEALAPGGVFAMQVPGNTAAPSHELMRQVAAEHPRRAELVPALSRARAAGGPEEYIEILTAAGLTVDAWETTYLHLLPAGEAEHPVLTWVRSTGLRPVEQTLSTDEFAAFTREYEARLRQAYPERPYGVALPFRRVFAIGRRAGGDAGTRPRVVGLDHVQVACAAGDEDAQRAFYVGLLGMTEIPKPSLLAARGGCWFAGGEAVIHVGVEAGFTPARKAHPCLLVPDLDTLADRLADAHLPVEWDTSIPGIRRFHTRDGSGNRVEIQQVD